MFVQCLLMKVCADVFFCHIPGALDKLLGDAFDLHYKLKNKGDSSLDPRIIELKRAIDIIQDFTLQMRGFIIAAESIAADALEQKHIDEADAKLETALAHHDGFKSLCKRLKPLL